MQPFHVLERSLPIHQNYLLEASAGTGKTFSIQNIVVRLLIEPHPDNAEPLSLDKILVVTFTRAAARDLKQRIRLNIERSIDHLNQWIESGGALPDSMADYLVACAEKGMEAALKAKKRLQSALFCFEKAQIFTIHGFCARMLSEYSIESNTGIYAVKEEETIPRKELQRVILDFFRTEMRLPRYSPGQLAIILKEDPDHKQLLRALSSSHSIEKYSEFSDLFERFKRVLTDIKERFQISSVKAIEDFQNQSGAYRNRKSGESKNETLAKIKRFVLLFDQSDWSVRNFDDLLEDGLVWVEALDPSLLKSQASPKMGKLHFPSLTEHLRKELAPLLREAGGFPFLLARLARDCKILLKRYQTEEEKFFPDDFLLKMNDALADPQFLNEIQARYQAAIIDEFQDTDPLQWTIFRKLFNDGEEKSWKGNLYLVGDPKQSIYSFRQADIYTYLDAIQAVGEERLFSLETNYRSQYRLVHALNTLFAIQRIPNLIPLPKRSISLPYRPVKAAQMDEESIFQDNRGALHFFVGDAQSFTRSPLTHLENQVFFPFIADELMRLNTEQKIAWGQCAVLVRDRFQALRLTDYFAKRKIPYVNQRGTSLADSPALSALTDLIRAVLNPRDLSAIKLAMGSSLIGWNYERLLSSPPFERILPLIQMLRKILFEQGFAHFFNAFLQSNWKIDGISVKEQLLSQEGGLELYQDAQQIADLIIDSQGREWIHPEELIAFLDEFSSWQENEDDRIKRSQNPEVPGVKILTLHFSKGLEFDIVFALGLISRTAIKEVLIPVEKDSETTLSVLVSDDPRRRHYFEEIDAEKMRQLYVAMTRAKLRLYLPAALNLPKEEVECGEASPMELFIERFSDNGKSFFDFLSEHGREHHISYEIEGGKEGNFESMVEPQRQLLSLKWTPKAISIPFKRCTISSFSNLAVQASHTYDSAAEFPHLFHHEEKSAHTLPAGRETGILIHTLFEKLSFASFRTIHSIDDTVSLIRPFINNSSFEGWEYVIASILFSALKTTIACLRIPLASINDAELYKEMPFLFSQEQSGIVENVEIREGFIKGVIDLIFMHEGFYYILDWKTNWLGPDDSYYGKENLERAMRAENYFLQATLYQEALRRYVNLVDRRPFEECFGGMIYFFVRGVGNEESRGIYFKLR